MAEKVRCESCEREFSSLDGLEAHNKAKHPELIKEEKIKKSFPYKKVRNWGIFLVIIILIVGGIYFSVSNIKTLPPTDMQGHVEASPESHVLREPMPITIQKHMLEHADGTGPPGVIINYNCGDYKCEEGLIEDLESFAEKYPLNVYVAPFKGMDAKIALTKLGRIEVLEEYDEEIIDNFVRL